MVSRVTLVVVHSNRRRRTERRLAAFLAIAALLVPVLLPHVHASPVAGAGVRVVGSARATNGAADHSSSTCPLCRARNDGRSSLLPTTVAVPLPAAALTGITTARVATPVATSRDVAAPRAPPRAS